MEIKNIALIIMFCLSGMVFCGEPVEYSPPDSGERYERNEVCFAQCRVKEAYVNVCEGDEECCDLVCR